MKINDILQESQGVEEGWFNLPPEEQLKYDNWLKKYDNMLIRHHHQWLLTMLEIQIRDLYREHPPDQRWLTSFVNGAKKLPLSLKKMIEPLLGQLATQIDRWPRGIMGGLKKPTDHAKQSAIILLLEKVFQILDENQPKEETEEGLGKQLATAAVAGTMAMAQPGQAQTPPQTTTATVVIDGETRTFDMGKMDVRRAANMLEKRLEASGVTNWSATVSDGKQRANIRSVDQGIGMQNRQD